MDSEQEHTPEERATAIRKMQAASDVFYKAAIQTGVHAFIEFTGLMNEYISVCAAANADGKDFMFANTHNSISLPIEGHHVAYLAEKLDCIYGPALKNPKLREFFLQAFLGQ